MFLPGLNNYVRGQWQVKETPATQLQMVPYNKTINTKQLNMSGIKLTKLDKLHN